MNSPEATMSTLSAESLRDDAWRALTLETLLSDETLRRQEFPVVEQKVFLAHAAVCPLPACVVRAVSAHVEQAGRAGQFEYLHRSSELQARTLSAELLGATPEEIAFVASTSAGVSQVAAGLDWRPGDEVVIADGDFPANVYPWLNLQRLGVRVRLIPRRPTGAITWEDVEEQLSESTRLVSLSSLHYVTGAPLDVDGIGRQLQARGILFCVDAIQSFGAVPTAVQHVDFPDCRRAQVVAGSAGDWRAVCPPILLGPAASGAYRLEVGPGEQGFLHSAA